jgi:sulfite reductase alpha subunit
MHCINVMNKALKPGKDRGAAILIGGKRALKVGDLMGTVIVPFIKLETDEDFEKLVAFGRRLIDFFAENALEHERIGETIDRIGLPAFLEAIEVDPDPNMVNHPRTSCYVRTDDFTEEAEKYFERKRRERGLPEAAE